MDLLKMLRHQSEGCDTDHMNYDCMLTKLRCVSNTSPPARKVDYQPIMSCAFAKKEKQGHVLAAVYQQGYITAVDTRSQNGQNADSPPLYCVAGGSESRPLNHDLNSVQWSEVDMKLITPCRDQTVGLWILRDGELTRLNSFRFHKRSVLTACFKPQNSDIFASGDAAGCVHVWDSRVSFFKPTVDISYSHRTATANGVWKDSRITCVVFEDEIRLISCSKTDPNISVWDLRKIRVSEKDAKPIPVYQLPSSTKCGFTHMVINKNRTKLYANSLGHYINCYNISGHTKTPVSTYYGHVVRPFYSKLSLSPDEKYIACTDADEEIYFWKTNTPGQPISMLYSRPYVLKDLSDVAWCPEDNLKIATSCDHFAPWIWTVRNKNCSESDDNAATSNDGSTISDDETFSREEYVASDIDESLASDRDSVISDDNLLSNEDDDSLSFEADRSMSDEGGPSAPEEKSVKSSYAKQLRLVPFKCKRSSGKVPRLFRHRKSS